VDEEQGMNDRIERLRAEAAELKVGKETASRDGLYQVAGAVAMGVGAAVALTAYWTSLGKSDSRDIDSLMILAIAMLALAVVGAAVFLRYSLARFLRFWLLRQLYEGQAHLDQLVASIDRNGDPASVRRSFVPESDAYERRNMTVGAEGPEQEL